MLKKKELLNYKNLKTVGFEVSAEILNKVFKNNHLFNKKYFYEDISHKKIK